MTVQNLEAFTNESDVDVDPNKCDTKVERIQAAIYGSYTETYSCIGNDVSTKCKEGYWEYNSNDEEVYGGVCEVYCRLALYN
jgi:hypothetical protein